MLYMELGPTEAATRSNVPIGTMTKWASRYGWSAARAVPLQRKRPALGVSHYVAKAPNGTVAEPDSAATGAGAALSPSEALQKARQELDGRTRTALARATAAAAEKAASQPPPPVLSTSHLRELAAAASRVFDWDGGKGGLHVHADQALVITQEQLAQIRALRSDT
jgi:hypothetical protein